MLRLLLSTCLLPFLFAAPLRAQYVTEVFVNDDNVAHEIWLGDTVALDGKLTYFSYTRFRVNHGDQDLNELLSFVSLTYNLSASWGLIGGGNYTFGRFLPLAGISFQTGGDNFYLYVSPYLVFDADVQLETFLLLQYFPRLSDRWGGFGQLLLTPNLGGDGLNFVDQSLRLGLDRNGWQFGLGLDVLGLGIPDGSERRTEWSTSLGVFGRRVF